MSQLLLTAVSGALGLAVGSLNTALVDRVPDEEQVRLPWRCPTCRAAIAPADSIPALSWLRLQRRCRACSAPISSRYPLMELATASLFIATCAAIGLAWELPAFLFIAGIGVALAVIDLDTMRLPNALTRPSYPILAGLLLLPTVVEGRWDDLLRAALGGMAMFAFYLLLHIVNPGGMGLGDVKFSGFLGMALAWLGWHNWVVGVTSAFLLSAVAGLVLILQGRGRKARMPFGPFMIAGALLGILYGDHVFAWYVDALAG